LFSALKREFKKVKRTFKYYLVIFLFFLPLLGWAQEPTHRWRRYSPEEREKIQRNHERWKGLSQEQKEHLLRKWREVEKLSPNRRKKLEKRHERFIHRFSPEERREWRRKFDRGLSPEEKKALDERLKGKRSHRQGRERYRSDRE
jgi:hypothetical protein